MKVKWCKECDEIIMGEESCECSRPWSCKAFIWIMALGAGLLLGLTLGKVWP